MTCRELTELVVAYLDGELPPERATECRGHLRVCAACRSLADQHARLRDALVELPAVEPPPALWAQINARLGAEEIAASERPAWRRALARWASGLRPIATPAALALSAGAVALGVVHLRGSSGTGTAALTDVAARATPAPTPVPVEPPPVVVAVGRDALDEAADRDGAADARFRAVTADLLALARAEAAGWPASRAKRFARDVERREQAVLAAAPGRDRERAWHELTSFLERAALGEQVASR